MVGVTVAHIYVGLRPGGRFWEANKGKDIDPDIEFTVEQVKRIVTKYFYGATLDEAIGIWKDERKGVISETSVVITLMNCCSWHEPPKGFSDRVMQLAADLLNSLLQDSVIVQTIYQTTDRHGEVKTEMTFDEILPPKG
jgi:hypothetical protein